MTKKGKSAKSSVLLKKVSLGDLIINGLQEGIAHARGEIQLRTRAIDIPDPIDVQAVRSKLGVSQQEFASRYGFSLRTLQEWEQGRSAPDSAVRAYLTVIDRNPEAVVEALTSRPR